MAPDIAQRISVLIDEAIAERKECLAAGVPSVFTVKDWELVALLWPNLDHIRALLLGVREGGTCDRPSTPEPSFTTSAAVGYRWFREPKSGATCVDCGAKLSDVERTYYGVVCERCEGVAFHATEKADVTGAPKVPPECARCSMRHPISGACCGVYRKTNSGVGAPSAAPQHGGNDAER